MADNEEEMPSQLRKHLDFVPFSYISYQQLLQREQLYRQMDLEGKERAQEARLKDGELQFGDDANRKRPDKNPDLEEGQWLKEEYGEPPPYYLGLPLEEIDEGIEEKTFVVLTRRLYRIQISRFSATPAGFCLPPWNPVRRLTVYVCTNQIFDFFILFTILFNCICLAVPSLNDLNWLELVFFTIYSVEMVVKVLARGLVFSKYTYLRDPWNWLDFIVIVSGVATFTMHFENESNTGVTQALRTFRVLRAVKTISIFPGLRTIVNAMLRAIKMLLEVVLLTIFCLLVFSLVSVQIYRGSLRQKCVMDPNVLIFKREIHESYSIFYRRMLHEKGNWALDQNGNYMLCGNATGAGRCTGDYICQPNIGGNPNNGFMNFDNIYWSAIITFQLMTIDFWENAYRKVLLTNGSVTVIFFVMVVFFGSFYLLNLMLAVVTITYQEEAERTNRELENEKNAKKQRKHAVATFYNMTSLATKQNMWAKIIHENKSKEKFKDNENPIEKVLRMKRMLNKWKKSVSRTDMIVIPDAIPHFLDYASRDRSPLIVAQNVLYTTMKWRMFVKQKHKERSGECSVDVALATSLLFPSNTALHSNSMCTSPAPQVAGQSLERNSQSWIKSTDNTAPSTKSGLPTLAKMTVPPWQQRVVDFVSPSSPAMTNLATWNRGNDQGHNVRKSSQGDPVDSCVDSNVNADVEEVAVKDSDFLSVATPSFCKDVNSANQSSLDSLNVSGKMVHQLNTKLSFSSAVSTTLLQRRQTKIQQPQESSQEEENTSSKWDSQLYRILEEQRKQCFPSIWSYLDKWFTRFRHVLHEIVTDIFFDLFINFVIVVNTIIMSSEHHGMSENTRQVIKIGSIVFTLIFALEAILKIAGLGVRGYFSSSWNRFDFLVAVGSVISSYLETEQFDQYHFNKATFLRAFRLLRILKLAQVWPAMNLLLNIIGSALDALGQLTCILLIILYIFAIIGLHLFKDKYTPINFPNGVPRWNFNDFFHSFMLMFRVLCGEWIEPLWDCMKITEVHAGLCMMVFLPTLIFGNFIVLNLFLALLLNAFADVDSSKQDDAGSRRLKEAKQRFIQKFHLLINCCRRKPVVNKVSVLIYTPLHLETEPVNNNANDLIPNDDPATGSATVSTASVSFMQTQMTAEVSSHSASLQRIVFSNVDSSHQQSQDSSDLLAPKEIHRRKAQPYLGLLNKVATKQNLCEEDVPSCFPSFILYHFPNKRTAFNKSRYGRSWMKFRTSLMKKVDSDVFEYTVLFFIIASSFAVAIEDYEFQLRPEGDWLREVADKTNFIFMFAFTVEMLLRWVAFGISQYFTNSWTIIDFIVVVVTILSVVAQHTALEIQSLRALLALRALRPLRVVSRIQGMKIVVNSLMRAIPAILNVFVVSLVFWLIFSVMGVQFYAGKFYKCIDLQTKNKVNVTGKEECLQNSNYTWFNSHINFDHIANGFLALFQVATFEGWMEIMQDAVDSTEVDQQPQLEASFSSYLYFIAFVICGSFFSLNLVIGVIIDNFNILKRKYEGSFLDAFLTLNQRNYYNTLKKMSTRKPQKIIAPPQFRFQKVFYELSVSDRFELILMGVVFLNMIAVGIEYYNYIQRCLWQEVMFTAEIAFSTFFALEAVLKIVGLRLHYFTLPWNVYDFVVALLSVVCVGIRMTSPSYIGDSVGHEHGKDYTDTRYILDHGALFSPTFLRFLRIFRISRALRIIKVAKGLRKVMYSLVISLPAIVNIMALLALFLFVYAVFGMFLFPNVKLTGALTPQMNFRSVLNSYLMLLCLSTAAGWNDILDALMIQPPFCNSTHHLLTNGTWIAATNGDCGNWAAIPFMVSYIIITFLFIINLYIAVILENYQQAHQQEEVGVTEDDFDMFYTIWQRYDPHATQFIPYAMLSDFVADLEPPLGIEKPNEIALVSINLPILDGDRVHCLDILLALGKNVLADIEEGEDMDQLKRQINEKFSSRFPNRARMNIISTTIQRKKEDVAARTLQRAWQTFKTQQTIYSIMKLTVKDRLKSNSLSFARTTPTVEELGHNLSIACRMYMQKLFNQASSKDPRFAEPHRRTSTSVDLVRLGTPV